MAGLSTGALDTYELNSLREDLQEAYISISPTEMPFQALCGSKDIQDTYYEWLVIELAATSNTNRVLEGENAPANDNPHTPRRLGNFTQISDKVAEVTSTAEAHTKGAGGNLQKMSKQVALQLKALKRDMEVMLMQNIAANAGADAVARVSAGFLAFLQTNTSRGAGAGANPILSGTTQGYPSTAAVAGTARAITETLLKTVIAAAWDQGADPSTVLVNSAGKQKISSTFTGTATRYKDAEDKKAVAAIDIYISDFGELQIVPSRFMTSTDCVIIDPSYVRVGFFNPMKQSPLAKTGHAERVLIAAEYGLQVDNEKAHGVIADINWAL
jgi:uncharacterized protein DUF5309